jgi:uncharacterized protein YrrD
MAEATDFRTGTDVLSSDGEKLGDLKGVILRRADLTVTAVVVDIGFLRSGRKLWEGGLGLDYDRVVRVDAVESAGEEKVVLKLTAGQFKDAPPYSDDHFQAAIDFSPNEFDLSDVVTRAESLGNQIGGTGSFWLYAQQNRSKEETDIEEKTPVWRQEPHDKLGEVDRVLVDEATGKAKAIVIRRGFILKRDVVLPVRYISEILDFAVHVDISDAELDLLQEFHTT